MVPAPPPQALHARARLFAAVEVALAAAIVIAHNVYHAVPNEVPLLVLLLIVSLLLRRARPASVGLASPRSPKLVAAVALVTGILLQLKDFLTEPLAHLIWSQPEHVSNVIAGNAHASLLRIATSLAIVWTFAAFGEEFAYRALLLRRTADALGNSRTADLLALLFSSILFGFGHFYKGPTGVLDSTCSGLLLGAAYLLTGRNLWAPILAHGLSDTIAVVVTAMGW